MASFFDLCPSSPKQYFLQTSHTKSLLLLSRPSPKGYQKRVKKKTPSRTLQKSAWSTKKPLKQTPKVFQKSLNFGSLFFWPLLGPTWASLAPSWPLWVPVLPPSCSILGQLGPSWGQVGLPLRPPGPSRCPSCPLSAPSWGKIGQTWACLEPFGAYLAHPGPSSGQLTASLCFYLAVVDWQQCSQQACSLRARKLHLRDLQNLNNFAIGTTVSNSIARRCLFS